MPFLFTTKTTEMDIRHYFDPVNFSQFSTSNYSNRKYSIGSIIEKKTLSITEQNIQKLDIAIVGAPFDSRNVDNYLSESPDKVREELYQLSAFNVKVNVADFGNLKLAKSIKGNYQALRDIIEFFSELKIVPVIIGGSQDLSFGISEAFKNNKLFSFSTIDAFLDIKKGKESFNSSNYLSRIFSSNPNLFQFNVIGYQSHYIASEIFSKTKGISNNIRLGQLRDNIALVEPVLRNTDVLSFDIGAVKFSEAPGSCNFSPNGLRSEEACQLAKFAGLSDRLKVFGVFEYDSGKDQHNLTAKLVAQIVWYFLEGFLNRQNERPDKSENNVMYSVEVKDIDKPLVFYKNTKTNRWWMQIQTFNNKTLYFACSEDEYIQASNNEIPELWLNYVQKLDETYTM